MFHQISSKFDNEKLPSTSSSITNHAQRLYFQGNLWYKGAFMQSVGLIPKDYRYKCKGDANMTPLIIGDSA